MRHNLSRVSDRNRIVRLIVANCARVSTAREEAVESFPEEVKKTVTNAGAKAMDISVPQEICTGVYTTGAMGRAIEEQALIITTDKGAVVITGCSHPGIVEIVRKARELTGLQILRAVGGFHLLRHSEEQIGGIIEDLKKLDVRYVGHCHCTGAKQIEMFRKAYGERFLDIGVGRKITGVDFFLISLAHRLATTHRIFKSIICNTK